MQKLLSLFAATLLACPTASVQRPAPAPTKPSAPVLLISNARIFTAEDPPRWAEAIALREERILAVGSAAEVEAAARAASSQVTVVDAGGRVIVPGFNDAHYHGGTYPEHVELDAGGREPGFDAVVRVLTAAAAEHPPGTWLTVPVGGAVMADARAARASLDRITDRHPVVLENWGGHSRILNSPALAALGFDDGSVAPRGGVISRDPQGHLDGRLVEYANYLAARRFAGLASADEQVARYRTATARFAERGLTSIQDMAGIRAASELASLIPAESLPVRWRLFRMPLNEGKLDLAADRVAGHRAVKWILDGTPVEAGAAMTTPYADLGGRGALNFSDEEVRAFLLDAAAAGEQPAFHTVGDAAIAQVLDAMDATGGATRWRAVRVRLEHADLMTPAQVSRCRDLGVVVVINPAHLMTAEMMKARYGDHPTPLQPVKSLLAGGVAVAIGSDGPTNPYLNLVFATMHPVNPKEALTREEAVAAYTRGSAYAELAEVEKGTLSAGKLADLVVLSQDIFAVAPDVLPKTMSVLTLVGGKVVHDAGVLKR